MAIAPSARSPAAGPEAFRAGCCSWPSPFFFIQTPQEVWSIWQCNQQVRRVYLNREHSPNPKPSWFGESVGHYEEGEPIIDSIGSVEHPYSFVGNYRTPRTKDLHVVERWKIVDDGNAIEATVTVEDPGTFNAPWWALARWYKINRGRPLIESICAETT